MRAAANRTAPRLGDFTITRVLAAPRSVVFRVRTDPKHFAQ
jgi:uncharacterized protein YndB with AHSA1/START domain